jgi:predicted DNA-binding protein with PD1-like motif
MPQPGSESIDESRLRRHDMQHRCIAQDGERTHVLVFETDDDVLPLLEAFASDQGIGAARFTAIGALRRVTLGYFDWRARDYVKIPLEEQVEVLSLVGDVARKDDAPKVHAHLVVGKRDGSAHGGHLLAGIVRPTLELVLVESPTRLRRRYDPESGLALIDPDA